MTILVFTFHSHHMEKIHGYTPHLRKDHAVSLFPLGKRPGGKNIKSTL